MDATETLLASEARVATNVPRRYLGQLCKHFEHRLPVELGETHGRITFPAGVCEADVAGEGVLRLRVSAADEAALANLEDVVARHLVRFAFREAPEVVWTRLSEAGPQ